MLKKFEKLENFLNARLEGMIQLITKLLLILLPTKLIEGVNKLHLTISTSLSKAKHKVFDWGQNLKSALISAAQSVLSFVTNFGSIQSQFFSTINNVIQNSVTFIRDTPLNKQFHFITKYIKPTLKQAAQKAKQVSSSQSSIAVMALLMISGGIFGTYHSSKQIYIHETKNNRAPASAQQYDYKPDYKMFPRRTAKFLNLKIPLMVEKIGDVNSITIDFSVRTSTRFAKIYLEDYEYKLKDHFFTSVRPIASDFPLQDEGKQVLKDIIRREVDHFLLENNVEGKVEEIRILFIVGS